MYASNANNIEFWGFYAVLLPTKNIKVLVICLKFHIIFNNTILFAAKFYKYSLSNIRDIKL